MMTLRLTIGILISAILAVTGTAQAAMLAVYDFDSLSASAGGVALATQDNWTVVATGNAVVRNDQATYFSGASGNIAYGTGTQNGRVNDGNFSYSLGNWTFEMAFKVRRHTTTFASFALAADADNDNMIENNAEIGPQFGWSSGSFWLREANQGAQTSVASGLTTDTIGLELVLRVDPNANGGDGAGSFFYRSLAAPYPTNPLIAVAGLQNIDLGLTNMAAGFQTPSTWNGIYVRLISGGAADDLTIFQVPEPNTWTLGLVGLVSIACRAWAGRRRKK